MRNIITKSCLFQFYDGTAILKDRNIIALSRGVKKECGGLIVYKVGLDDKLRIEGELEIEDESNREGMSQFGPYAKFISHIKLVFKKRTVGYNFLNKIRNTKNV